MTRSYAAHRRDIALLRLGTQRVSRAAVADASPADTVRHLLAMQAQDFAGAKWSVGVRTPGSTDAAIEAALAAGEIVRSWPMRGTLHFVPPADLGWMLSLTSARTIRSAAGRHRQLELVEADFERARDIAVAELHGGRALSRADLLERFETGGISVAGQRGVHLIARLALWGVLVFGPLRAGEAGKANQQTFVLLDEWVTAPRTLERDEALGEFALRYFTGHGPATVRDFAWWSSLTLGDARAGLAIARDRLDELDLGGTQYFVPRDAAAATSEVLALPGFDEYLLGYQDRGAVLAQEHSELIVPGKNGMFMPTIVVGGEVVGTWRRTITAKGVTVEPQPFDPLSATSLRRFEAAVGRYAAFLGLPLLAR
ncbi:winged helix DNA-binding domain-containing protein [Conyzicola sp.]|uniref:winged helix DNA-binding domain-containing protein n=1 Tax=Conyzicola sp. TaxID=1969404 RepID=UPI003989CED7